MSTSLYSWLPRNPKGTAELCSGSTIGEPWADTSRLTVNLFCLMRRLMRGRWRNDGANLLCRSISEYFCSFHKGVIMNSFSHVKVASRNLLD